jgi:hypothetical protein
MEGYDIMVGGSTITSTPGGSATVILFDSTAFGPTGATLSVRKSMPEIRRGIVTILADQVVTFFHDSIAASSSTWDTVNGSGVGEATTANTLFERDCLIIGDDFRFKVVTTTGPGTWRCTVRLSTQRALGQ